MSQTKSGIRELEKEVVSVALDQGWNDLPLPLLFYRNDWLVTVSPRDNGWAGLGLNALRNFATIKTVLRLKVEHWWEGCVLKWLYACFCHTWRGK